MSPDNWLDVKRLFHEALELSPEARATFLFTACGQDAVLYAEVESLLDCYEPAQNFIEGSAGGAAAALLTQPDEMGPGQQIGRYRVIREIGRGGMGVVFLAERDDVGNRVAIKVLANGSWSASRRERFASEERTLAGLKHDFIAQLYDAGVLEDGTPWFAMEYVDGVKITDHCQTRSIEECLKLFRSVCEAVHYAHGQLVVHRDLKPSNILVRTNEMGATPKLLDFGIAKQLDASAGDDSNSTDRFMTPGYAAPEQFQGTATVQTDIYSLGVILYELIAGRLPFKIANQSAADFGRASTEKKPENLSTATKKTSSTEGRRRRPRTGSWTDLDALCFTAMHKDLERRYKSVDSLIRDIDNYLESKPLEVRCKNFSYGDRLAYKLNKFGKRNRVGVIAAAIVLTLGIGWGTFFAVGLTKARNEALRAADRTQRIQRFMADLFTGGDQQAGPSIDLKVITLIEQGVRDVRSLDREPEIQAEIYHTLGNSYRHLGVFDKADSLLQTALDRRRTLLGPDHPQVAESLVALGLLRIDQARLDEAERLIREGLEKTQRARPFDKGAVATATTALGNVLSTRGDYNLAIPILEEAVKLHDAGPPSPELVASLSQLADANFYAGRYEVSDALNRRLLSIGAELYNDRHISVANVLVNLAAIQIQWGHFKEAEQLYQQALSIAEAWYGKVHQEVASILTQLGQTLARQKRYDEAEKLLEQALDIDQRVYPKDHPRIAFALNELGYLAYGRDKLGEAEARFSRAAELNRAAYGDSHFTTITAMSNLAGVYYTQKDYARAEKTLREVVDGYAAISPGHLNTGIARIKLGRALLRQRKYKEAEAQTLAGYEIVMGQKSPDAAWVQDARKVLVAIYEGSNEPEKAAKFRSELAKQ